MRLTSISRLDFAQSHEMVGSRAKPFRCLWCDNIAKHWRLEFVAVFAGIDEWPKGFWWLKEARGGRSASEAFTPRACHSHRRELDAIIARCANNDVKARFEFHHAGKFLYVFKTWKLFRNYIEGIMA